MVKVVAQGTINNGGLNNEKTLVDPVIVLAGKDGKDGVDGAPGVPGQDGLPGRDGKDGKDGRDGRDGIDGKDGVSSWIEYDNKTNTLSFKNNGGLKSPDPIKLPSAAKGWGFAAGSGRGGVTAQADWNQTDKHAVDYIKNKPVANPPGDLIPDFDNMTPIETHTFDVDTTDFYEILSIPNTAGTYTNATDAQCQIWCRIITTNKDGTSTTPRIYQELDCVFREFGSTNQVIYGVMLAKPEAITAAATGIQNIRSVCPKTLNSGYKWAIELKPYNNTARKVTVQVYKTEPRVTWNDTAVVTTYNATYHNVYTASPYNNPGYVFLGTVIATVSSAASATSAGYITGSMSKTLASSTLKNTGYAITGNSLLFKVKGQALLAGIQNTSVAIDTDFGICQAGTTAASSATGAYTYTNFYQKHQFTPASSVNFSEAYANGDMLYARFTLSAGNIYSDNICSTTPTAGHTWYCIGMATSASAINFDNTDSYFFTLDASGKITHINGKEIASNGGGGSSTPQPRTVYDKTTAITSGTVALADDTVFYTDTPAASTTYTIDTSNLTQTGSMGCLYFNVLINMPSTAVGIDFTTNNSITWTENTTPNMSTGGRTYLLAFQSFDAGASWIGSLATWWYTPTP